MTDWTFPRCALTLSVRSRHGKQSWAIHILVFSTGRRQSTEQCHWHTTCRYLPSLLIYWCLSPQFPQFQLKNGMKCSWIAGMQCIPQRAALLKSMLNFLKKAIQDPAFSDGIRHGGLLSASGFDKYLYCFYTVNSIFICQWSKKLNLILL